MPQKVKVLARRSAVILKVREDRLRVVEDFNIETPKTRDMSQTVNMALGDQKILFLTPDFNDSISRSVRNLLPERRDQGVLKASTRDLLNCSTIGFQKSAVAGFVKGLTHAGISGAFSASRSRPKRLPRRRMRTISMHSSIRPPIRSRLAVP